MKLYALECARLIAPDTHIFGKHNTPSFKYLIPVSAFLLVHPRHGLILFDTGLNVHHMPDLMRADIATSPYYSITAHLERLGYSAKDVAHVILSHLHFDHAGQLQDFSHAVFHLRKSEYDYAQVSKRPDYLPEDIRVIEKLQVNFVPEDCDMDLFGDCSVLCLDTKGHSPGHQSSLITFPDGSRLLLAFDAAHTSAFLTDHTLLDEAWNKPMAQHAIERICLLSRSGATLIFGHDPEQWYTLKKAPDCYI